MLHGLYSPLSSTSGLMLTNMWWILYGFTFCREVQIFINSWSLWVKYQGRVHHERVFLKIQSANILEILLKHYFFHTFLWRACTFVPVFGPPSSSWNTPAYFWNNCCSSYLESQQLADIVPVPRTARIRTAIVYDWLFATGRIFIQNLLKNLPCGYYQSFH